MVNGRKAIRGPDGWQAPFPDVMSRETRRTWVPSVDAADRVDPRNACRLSRPAVAASAPSGCAWNQSDDRTGSRQFRQRYA